MKEYKYKINGTVYNVTVGDIENNMAQVEVNGTPYKVEMEQTVAPVAVSTPRPSAAPRTVSGEKVIAKPTTTGGAGAIKAPLPGVVLDIKVNVGDAVNAGDTVVILEAMKMENNINGQSDGEKKRIAGNCTK